jgi:hypothetical protein
MTVATAGAAAATELADGASDVVGDEAAGAGAGAAEAEAGAEATAFGTGRAPADGISPSRQAHDTRMASRIERTPLASAKTCETVKGLVHRLDFLSWLDDTARA